MDEGQINKILRPGIIVHIITIIFIVATIGILGTGFVMEFNAKNDAKDLGELIENYQDKAGIYAKIDMAIMPYGFAEEDNGRFYYFAKDKAGYMYIVRLTDGTYEELKKMYNDGEGEVNYELSGYTFSIPTDLKKLAIETTDEIFEDNEINYSNFEDYVGNVYIDETKTPEDHTPNILYGISVITGIFTFVMIITSASQIARTRKFTKNKELIEEVREELKAIDDNEYRKLKIYLTNKYIVSRTGGISIFEYKDVIWVYATVRYVNGIAQGRALMLCTKDKKKYTMAATGPNDTALDEIMTEIHDKNPNVRIGFTKENREYFKEYQKENM